MSEVLARSLVAVAIGSGLLVGCAGGEEAVRSSQTTGASVRGAAEQGPIKEEDHEAPEQSLTPLAGTRWRFVEFQSMDDAVGTVRPEGSRVFTMELMEDGTVAMQLDCNRATGSWSAEPSANPSNGRFELGPLAVTRALCPPPRLDERIAADAQYIRGYLLRDGRLYLSLMADAGVYSWERVEEPQ